MSINFENPEIQSILQNNAIEQHYSLDCMPTKLVDPSTDKANRCLYEKLDPSNYESGARMVAFRTTIISAYCRVCFTIKAEKQFLVYC
jgi:hypothetical protein